MNVKYTVDVPKTSKSKIKQPALVEEKVIPKLGTSQLFVGRTGSGKTVLANHLLKSKDFYGGAFHKIYLISATGGLDDIMDDLKIPDSQVLSNLEEASQALEKIQESQEKLIKDSDYHIAPQLAIVLDDVVGDTEFIKSPGFLRSFIAPRHFNETTFLCTQHLRKVPRACRQQAAALYVFNCSLVEAETLAEEFCPSAMNKKQFIKVFLNKKQFIKIFFLDVL